METAAHHASDRVKWERISLLLLLVILAVGCSQYRRSSPEALSPDNQARVAENLQQAPPGSPFPRGVPYQPISAEERALLEQVVVPELYGVDPPPLQVREAEVTAAPPPSQELVLPPEPSPTASLVETDPPPSPVSAAPLPEPSLADELVTADPPPPPPLAESSVTWTPYQRLSQEEKAFLENVVLPRLSPETTTTTARRATRTVPATPAPSSSLPTPASDPLPTPATDDEPTTTFTVEATETPDTAIPATETADTTDTATDTDTVTDAAEDEVEILFSAPADTITTESTPPPAGAPGPRRDRLDTLTEEERPGPRRDRLESAPPAVPPQATPDVTPEDSPPPASPVRLPPASSNESDGDILPDSAFPGSGETMASTANPEPAPEPEAAGPRVSGGNTSSSD